MQYYGNLDRKMKFLILISLIAASYADTNEIVDDLINSIKKAGIQCKLEVGATDADLAVMKAHEVPSTSTGKCFVACLDKKLNFMSQDGKFIKETGYNFIEKLKDFDAELYGKLMKLADTCYAEVEELSDACETATNMLSCFEREKKANGIVNFDI